MRGVVAGTAYRGQWTLRSGRALHWAPTWDDSDAELVFDAASGDYWVLSQAAADMLRSVTVADPRTRPGGPSTAGQAEELLTELQRCGLVEPAS